MDGLSSVELTSASLSPIQSQQRRHPAMDAAAKLLGMSTTDLRTALQSGQSLLSLASSKGISQDDLTAAMSKALQQANPNMTADQATKMATAIATRTRPTAPQATATDPTTQDPNAATPTGAATGASATHGHHHHHHGGGAAAMDAASKLLGMSTTDLTTALKSGQSLSSIATSKGVSQSDLTAAMATAIQGSNPNITADQAKEIATRMATQTPGTQDQQWNAGAQPPTTFSITA
ncbi:MAG TPA: hypothetical protein VF375_07335 [Candidatus Limnocylindrales bacterium]